MLPNIGAYVFGEDELGDILEDRGFVSVRTNNVGTLSGCAASAGDIADRRRMCPLVRRRRPNRRLKPGLVPDSVVIGFDRKGAGPATH